MSDLWVAKYQPKKIEDYVFKDERLKNQVTNWIRDGKIPHLLLHGGPGTGKSSLATVLINELGVSHGDVLTMNGSDTNSVDDVRNTIMSFVQTYGFGDIKIVRIEEADFLSASAQAALRDVMERYESTARFIMTCNHPHKISPAIHSRTQDIQIQKIDIDDFKLKLAQILVNEDVNIESDDPDALLNVYVQAYYPDLRKTIGMLQNNCIDGVLYLPSETNTSSDWQIEAVANFAERKIKEGREIVCKNLRQEECEEFFRMCYRNLDWWSADPAKQDMAILIIRDAIVKHSVIADHEINVSAMLIELTELMNE